MAAIGRPVITRGLVLRLGLSQLVCWGVSYYLIGVFGERIGADLGWPPTLVYGGFSAALVVQGLLSRPVGHWIDRYGGRPVMVAGSWLTAIGCVGLSLSQGLVAYYGAWVCLGVAMRMTLYDAAFAALARIGGPAAKGPIAQITLLGGLASTTFWPIGHALADAVGWRGALLVYAGAVLLTLPLHRAIPAVPTDGPARTASAGARIVTATRADRILAGGLYALIVMVTTFLNSGMSAHMIGILTGLGMGATLSVWTATLRGVGQTSARLGEVLFGASFSPLTLGVLAAGVLPVCFVIGLFSGTWVAAGIAFAFLYGAGNGLSTIVRGTLPLVLFDARSYGSLVGRLIAPSFYAAALAPIAYAFVIQHFGDAAALWISAALAGLTLAAALLLSLKFGRAP